MSRTPDFCQVFYLFLCKYLPSLCLALMFESLCDRSVTTLLVDCIGTYRIMNIMSITCTIKLLSTIFNFYQFFTIRGSLTMRGSLQGIITISCTLAQFMSIFSIFKQFLRKIIGLLRLFCGTITDLMTVKCIIVQLTVAYGYLFSTI